MTPTFNQASRAVPSESTARTASSRQRLFPIREGARQDVFGYIEIVRDPKRKPANKGLPPPVDFETRQFNLNRADV